MSNTIYIGIIEDYEVFGIREFENDEKANAFLQEINNRINRGEKGLKIQFVIEGRELELETKEIVRREQTIKRNEQT